MTVVLALDLGTTATAAVAVNGDGKQIYALRRVHAADITGLPAGLAEQSAQQHFKIAVDLLRELTERLEVTPKCIGLTGQMHSVLTVDAERRPVGNLITWQDRRANQPCGPSGHTYLEDLLLRCDADELFDSGCRLSPGYGPVSLYVLHKQGGLPKSLAGISSLADWVAAELTDGPIQTDRSNASAMGIYNLRQDCWSDSLTETCCLRRSWLPPVVSSAEVVGGLSSRLAAATGLPPGLPVCTAIGDNQASVLGSVPQGEPAIQITVGTGGQINWPVEEFLRIEGMETRPLPPDRMMLVGAGLAGGDAYAWVRTVIEQWLRAFGAKQGPEDVYATLARLAAEVPDDSEGLLCEPYFRGTRRDPLRRGTFSGITTANFSPGHVARAVLTGIATGFHSFWSAAGDARPQSVPRIIGCGNGLEQNPLLAGIISSQFSLPLVIPRHPEAAAYGAALLTGVQTGLWSDLIEAGRGIELLPAGDPQPADQAANEANEQESH